MNNIKERIADTATNLDFINIKKPRAVKIELSSICNHKCKTCMVSLKTDRPAFMSDEIFKETIKQTKEFDIKEIGLYHMGESILDKDIVNRLEYIKEQGNFFTYLTTNGSKYEVLKDLVKTGIDSIKFSMNGINRENHEYITGVDDFNEVLTNLKQLIKFRNDNNLKTEISVSCLYNDKVNQTDFIKMLKSIADTVVQTYTYSHVGNIQLQEVKNNNEVLDVHKDLCFGLVKLIHVLTDGNISICKWSNSKDFIIGNVLQDTLSSVWTNYKAMRLRNLHYNKKICLNCINVKGSI